MRDVINQYITDLSSPFGMDREEAERLQGADELVIEDYTRDNFTRALFIATSFVAIFSTIFHILYVVHPIVFGIQMRAAHLMLMGTVVFLTTLSIESEHPWRQRLYNFATIVILATFLYANIFTFFEYSEFYTRAGVPTTEDMVLSSILVLVTLEGTRRQYGKLFFSLGILVLLYGLFGDELPGLLGHGGLTWERMITALAIPSGQGVYGSLVGISATLVTIFVFFGVFLQYLGGADFFGDLAKKLAGNIRSGPAQVAIISSGFMGMLSGSAIANAASTGSFSIPLMKRTGYESNFAAGIESTASIGGQITPPIMGAAAFVMAAITGQSYVVIIGAAAIPAFMHYATIMITAHIRAVKEGFEPVPDSEKVRLSSLLIRSYYLIPVAVIVWSLTEGNAAIKSAWHGLGMLILLYSAYTIAKKRSDIGGAFKRIIMQLIKGADDSTRLMAPIAILLAYIAWMIEILTLTGLLQRLSAALVSLAGGSELVLLIMAAVLSIAFGLGLPTTPAYLLVALIAAPALVQAGFDQLGAHLFVLYYAVLSAITPPGAATCLVTAGLAGGSFLETAKKAVRFSLPTYLLPFMWVYMPGLLGQGSVIDIAYSVVAVAIMVLMIVSFFENYLLTNYTQIERIAALGVALLAVYPSMYTRGPAFGVFILILALQIRKTETRLPRGIFERAFSPRN